MTGKYTSKIPGSKRIPLKTIFIFAMLLILTSVSVTTGICFAADSSEQNPTSNELISDELVSDEFVSNELVVVFKNDTSISTAEKITGCDAEKIPGTDDSVILATEGKDIETVAEKVEKNKNVELVQPNFIYTSNSDNRSARISGSAIHWSLDYMDVPEAWNLIEKHVPKSKRTESKKIKIAAIDSGIDLSHPDLRKNTDFRHCVNVICNSKERQPLEEQPSTEGHQPPEERQFTEAQRVPNEQQFYESPQYVDNSDKSISDITSGDSYSNGTKYCYGNKVNYNHGTHLALIIGASSSNSFGTKGVASGNHDDLIQMMGINVFYKNPRHGQQYASTASILSGIQYARNPEHKADVMYMCLGHKSDSNDGYGLPHDDVALENAINEAVKDDIVVVCSAGNNNNRKCWYPSDFESCISVINTKKYSNVHSKKCRASSSNYGKKKDVSAPGSGVFISSSDGKFTFSSGTSAATANATGVVALIRYANRDLSVNQVKKILYSTTTDLYKKGFDVYTGHGNVNAYSAVAKAFGANKKIIPPKLKKPRLKIKAGKRFVILKWNKIKRANYYKVFRKNSHGKFKLVKKTAKTKWLNKHLKRNKKYRYIIKAFGTSKDGKATCSKFSKIVKKH